MNRADLVELADQIRPALRANARAADESASFPSASLAALRECGLLGLLVPAGYGGPGGNLGDLVTVAGILAQECLSTAMIWAMHCQQVDAIVHFGSETLKDRLLPRLASGGAYLASVTSEAETGGNLVTGSAPLISDQGTLKLRRHAPVVTGGAVADGFLITMRASPEAAPTEVTLVYADRSELAVEEVGEWNTLGMRGTHSIGLRLSGELPAANVLGEPGRFREIVVQSYGPAAQLGWSACWLGAARSALSSVVSALRAPSRPRRVDLRSELLAERLARVRIDVELAHAYLTATTREVLAHRAAGLRLDTPPLPIHLGTLKVAAAERAYAAVDRLVDIAGLDLGYRRDSALALERHLRDLRSASLNYANDRLMVQIGAQVLLDGSVRLVGAGSPTEGDRP